MGQILVSQLLSDTAQILKDAGHRKWTLPEWVGWYNEAIIQVGKDDPTALAYRDRAFQLSAGVTQAIPADSLGFVDIPCDAIGNPITIVDREVLDAIRPGWRRSEQSTTIKHYLYTSKVPREFEVYPPAVAGTPVHLIHARTPAPLVLSSGEEPDIPAEALIDVPDQYSAPVKDWILYRCFSVDAGNPAYLSRAAGHAQAYSIGMGNPTERSIKHNPNIKAAPSPPHYGQGGK